MATIQEVLTQVQTNGSLITDVGNKIIAEIEEVKTLITNLPLPDEQLDPVLQALQQQQADLQSLVNSASNIVEVATAPVEPVEPTDPVTPTEPSV
ncbi:hypothetical protein DAPPUDRAFT_346147 [Daphnia pulex]|uniref:Uncharacterized protein n=1 Tax=Daphnia pulex TaxID=6669 RepID=E9I7R9_DAPPU|nr:hypothetical protein DAPPUDRAFT_346147 [Daphnia pulex]|eukprot:EFX59961.1 hypothetical protein DAPPUDRAFT_346147 [Daphnia pulex]